MFALGGKALQDTADAQRFFDQCLVAVFLEVDIFNARLAPTIAMLRRQQSAEQGLWLARVHTRLHHDLVQTIAGQHATFSGAWRDRHRQ
ncbi:hypothetical protein D3C86_1866090 [compost metagenome]